MFVLFHKVVFLLLFCLFLSYHCIVTFLYILFFPQVLLSLFFTDFILFCFLFCLVVVFVFLAILSFHGIINTSIIYFSPSITLFSFFFCRFSRGLWSLLVMFCYCLYKVFLFFCHVFSNHFTLFCSRYFYQCFVIFKS